MTPADHSEGKWAAAFAPRSPNEKRYWLVKSEPDVFSFDDLRAAPKQTTQWDGIRNFAARNFLKDGMKRGDRVFFYHSSSNPQAIVGIAEVAREAYPDPTATDRKHAAFDASLTRDCDSGPCVVRRAAYGKKTSRGATGSTSGCPTSRRRRRS